MRIAAGVVALLEVPGLAVLLVGVVNGKDAAALGWLWFVGFLSPIVTVPGLVVGVIMLAASARARNSRLLWIAVCVGILSLVIRGSAIGVLR